MNNWVLGGMVIIFLLGLLSYLFLVVALRSPNLRRKILSFSSGNKPYFSVDSEYRYKPRVMPVTGVALPFISYGGSSLVVNLASAGLVYNISKSGGKESWKLWI